MREDLPGALANATSLSELEAFDWPHPDCIDRSSLKEQCLRHRHRALLYGFADVWQRPDRISRRNRSAGSAAEGKSR